MFYYAHRAQVFPTVISHFTLVTAPEESCYFHFIDEKTEECVIWDVAVS
jgi:hypothetical protein